jgi:hypothetical protein
MPHWKVPEYYVLGTQEPTAIAKWWGREEKRNVDTLYRRLSARTEERSQEGAEPAK